MKWMDLCFCYGDFLTFCSSLPAVFSAVTLLLLPHSQGNIWLFEDSVLITGKLPGKVTHFTVIPVGSPILLTQTGYFRGDYYLIHLNFLYDSSTFWWLKRHLACTDSASQPKVKFPKNLLTMSDKSNVSAVTAYLTVPQHHLAKDCSNCTPGVIVSKSGER